MNNKIKIFIKLIILIGSFYFINNFINFRDLEIEILHYKYLFYTLLVGLTSFILSALRWSIILDKFIQPQKFLKLLYILSLQALSGNFIPSIINEGVRIYFSKIIKMNISDSTTVVIVDRFFGIIAKFLFIGLSLAVFSFYFFELKTAYLIITIEIFFSILIILFIKKIWVFILSLFRFLKESKIKTFLRKGYQFLSIFYEHKKEAITPFVLSILMQILQIISFYFISKALFNEISIIPIIILLPIISLISTLPITFNGWGVRELLFIYFFQFFNYSEDTTFIASILFGLTSAVIPLIILSVTYLINFKK